MGAVSTPFLGVVVGGPYSGLFVRAANAYIKCGSAIRISGVFDMFKKSPYTPSTAIKLSETSFGPRVTSRVDLGLGALCTPDGSGATVWARVRIYVPTASNPVGFLYSPSKLLNCPG